MTRPHSSKELPKTYEQAIEQLEQILERIESGEIGLESSLSEYERGMKLVSHCRAILDQAEKKIAELTVDASGKLKMAEDADDDQPIDEAQIDDDDV